MASKDIFRDAARRSRLLLNAWVQLGAPYAVELVGEAGWDTVTIDRQHGIGDGDALIACLTAARAAGLPALVRVRSNDRAEIGFALDAGAQGVVCPSVNSGDEAELLVRWTKYPPRGERSWGPFRGRLLTGTHYFGIANDWTVACAQIESLPALENLDEILSVEGLDMVVVGTLDLSISLTGGRLDAHAPEVKEATDYVLAKCQEHGVMPGIFASDVAAAEVYAKAGWDIVTIGTDAGLLAAAMSDVVAAMRPA